ncbi:male sterility protein [Colletotrichum falcatum]|nr:male sterility protein [Colletotrichum falcatum]
MDFFKNQVILLTGATGGLGGCLLYKLAVVLRVPKIYVVIRKTPEKAIQTWSTTMPNHVDDILQTGSIKFISGNLAAPHYGIAEHDVHTLEKDVTIVINAAANISLRQPLRPAVQENCLSALDLGEMATRFTKLICFVQVSSAYALSDLPDGPMEERIYPIGDAEQLLSDILSGKTDGQDGFAWPYARSKRLMECLLDQRLGHRLPLLIVRPTSIGPAIREPFELYMPNASCPGNTFYARMMYPTGGSAVFHAAAGSASGKNTADEVPVDLVANVVLQHARRATRDVVHASSELYIRETFDDHLRNLERYVPADWRLRMAQPVFTTDRGAQQSPVAEFYAIKTRNWLVRTDRSRGLDASGPIGMGIGDHNLQAFTEKRVRRIFAETKEFLEAKEERAKSRQSESKL